MAMVTEQLSAGRARRHLIRLLALMLALLLGAALLVGAGSYWLLREHAIETVTQQAGERLDDAMAKLSNHEPVAKRSQVYFQLLKGRATAPVAPAGASAQQVFETKSDPAGSPLVLYAFDAGQGAAIIFEPGGIVGELIELPGQRIRIDRSPSLHVRGVTRPTRIRYYGQQRYWPGARARLIMVSRIAPVGPLSGRILVFTGVIVLMLMAAVTAVFAMAQRRFDQQAREIWQASDEIARREDPVTRLPSDERTELGRLSRQINEMIDKMVARGRLVRQNSFSLDHDYREPISLILAHARKALKPPGTAPDMASGGGAPHPDIREIHDIAEQMLEVAGERLDIYRFDVAVTEGDEGATEEVDLAELAEETPDSCFVSIENSGVSVSVSIEARPVPVRGSFTLLLRALSNLVRNAIAHSKPGDCVRLTVRSHNGAAEILVEDDAGGLPQGILEALAASQGRQAVTRSHREGGTGLGLQIAQAVMIAHRGQLTGENTRTGARMRMIFSPGLSAPAARLKQ